MYVTLLFCVSSRLLGPVQVLLWSGTGIFELWVTQSYCSHQRLKAGDITDKCSSHVCIVLSVCMCYQPTRSEVHTQPYMQLLWPALFLLLVFGWSRWEKVAELYSVKYRSLFLLVSAKEASRSTMSIFFSSSMSRLLSGSLLFSVSISLSCL